MRKNKVGGNQRINKTTTRSGLRENKDPNDFYKKTGKRYSDLVNYLGFRVIDVQVHKVFFKERKYNTIDWEKMEERRNQ